MHAQSIIWAIAVYARILVYPRILLMDSGGPGKNQQIGKLTRTLLSAYSQRGISHDLAHIIGNFQNFVVFKLAFQVCYS